MFKYFRVVALVGLIILFSSFAVAATVNSVKIGSTDKQLNVTTLSANYEHADIEVDIGGFDWTVINQNGNQYALISLQESGFTTEVGKPKLPVIRKLVEIPFGAEVSINIKTIKWDVYPLSKFGIDYQIYPAQEPIRKDNANRAPSNFIVNNNSYQTDGFYKGNPVRLVETGIIRGYRFATIDIFPIAYNPYRAEVRVISKMEIELTFKGSDRAETISMRNRFYSPDFEKIAKDNFINHLNFTYDYPTPPIGMIVIVANYLWGDPNVDAYITWKMQKGFYVDVQRAGDLGGTTTGIKSYIQNQYNYGDIPPTYIVLIGDTDGIPAWNGSAGSHKTDIKYVQLAGGDYFPDAEIGRLSARNSSQLSVIVEKAVGYEQVWPLNGTSWLNKACFIASDDPTYWSLAEATHRYVIQTHMAPNGIVSDSIWGHSGGNTAQIKSALNNGRIICNYSGHGSDNSWAGPSFTKSDISSLTNDGMYPLVISNACVTGKYNNTECFMEAWVRAPQKGAYAAIGASDYTYWDEDDWWERAAYDAYFWYGYYTIYGMDMMGDMAVYDHGSNLAQYYFEAYNLMGDPSTMPWFGTPREIVVSHDSEINIGQTTFSVHCAESGMPVEDVLVGLYMNGVLYGANYTNSSGDAIVTLNPPPSSPGTMYITCTSRRYLPVQDTVPVGGGSELSLTIDPDSTTLHRGGMLSYFVQLDNNGANPVSVDCWTMMRLPSGEMYGPMLGPIYDVNINAGGNVSGHFSHSIPSSAPYGNYTYFAYSGNYPNDIQAADSFGFSIESGIPQSQSVDKTDWVLISHSGGFDRYMGETDNTPKDFILAQNYPNPFNPATTFKFGLDKDAYVNLAIYNLRGELVKTIADGNYSAGVYEVSWNGTDTNGEKVSSGIYFYRLSDGTRTVTKKLSLLK